MFVLSQILHVEKRGPHSSGHRGPCSVGWTGWVADDL